MSIALIKLGQRIVKFDEFVCAYLIREKESDEEKWTIQMETNDKKAPVFFGTYLECYRELSYIEVVGIQEEFSITTDVTKKDEE